MRRWRRRWLGSLRRTAPQSTLSSFWANRRKRTERAPAPLSHLGPTGTNAGAAVSLQLEDVVGGGGSHVVGFLFPSVSRCHPQPAGHRVPDALAAPYSRQAAIVWDGLTGPRSHMTWEFIRHQRGQLWVKFLPGYAPERNPVECTCGRTGSTTSCRTFARLAAKPLCAAGAPSHAETADLGDCPSGSKPNCSLVTILSNSQ
jgi:hypothetical protein